MKNKKTLGAALLLSSMAFSGVSIAGGASAEALSFTCAGCHGYNGASTGPATPSLAGMSSTYIADSMKAYKSGDRQSTIMMRIAKGYDDDDFEKMGQFFSSKPMHMADQPSGKNAKKGKKIHKKSCKKCHEDGGTNPDDDAGQLAGQWTTYTKYSLEDAMEGTRDYGKKMMKKVKKAHKKYGDEMVPALLDYYASKK